MFLRSLTNLWLLSSGADAQVTIHPTSGTASAQITLRHFAEGEGIHYVVLEPQGIIINTIYIFIVCPYLPHNLPKF